MSHKNCECNDCIPQAGSEKRPIEIMPQVSVEPYWFLPEEDQEAVTWATGENPGRNTGFETKDSGQRQTFSTGMVRDIQTDKPRYDLLDMDMLKRWAELMARGAIKYGEENWRKAETEEEMKRFAASLLRHTFQLLEGDRTEDHGAAIMFNVSGYEMVRAKLEK